MTSADRCELQAARDYLRHVARRLRALAPTASLKADALATDVELRIKHLEVIT